LPSTAQRLLGVGGFEPKCEKRSAWRVFTVLPPPASAVGLPAICTNSLSNGLKLLVATTIQSPSSHGLCPLVTSAARCSVDPPLAVAGAVSRSTVQLTPGAPAPGSGSGTPFVP
jgi:hypothetical protein